MLDKYNYYNTLVHSVNSIEKKFLVFYEVLIIEKKAMEKS